MYPTPRSDASFDFFIKVSFLVSKWYWRKLLQIFYAEMVNKQWKTTNLNLYLTDDNLPSDYRCVLLWKKLKWASLSQNDIDGNSDKYSIPIKIVNIAPEESQYTEFVLWCLRFYHAVTATRSFERKLKCHWYLCQAW